MNYSPLNGSLKGANFGIVGLDVIDVTSPTGSSSSSLPRAVVKIVDASTACAAPLFAPPRLFTTYTQAGWDGTNPAVLTYDEFQTLYPAGIQIGSNAPEGLSVTFRSAAAVKAFLSAGGTAKVLTASAVDPKSTAAGVFAGNVLALKLNVAYSDKGASAPGWTMPGSNISKWFLMKFPPLKRRRDNLGESNEAAGS